jgi:aminopeptidase N
VSCRKFKSFDEDDVWEALTSQAREDMTLEEPITVQQIAKSWLTKDRFPVVSVTRDYYDNSAYVEQVRASVSFYDVGHKRIWRRQEMNINFW